MSLIDGTSVMDDDATNGKNTLFLQQNGYLRRINSYKTLMN